MKYTPEYLWLESYLDNDSLWVEDSLAWDDAFDLLTLDYNIFSFLTTTFFVNSHFFLDSLTKFSFLDVLLLSESSNFSNSKELFDLIMWDLTSLITVSFFPAQFFFYTDHQEILPIILHHSPELSFAILDFINTYWLVNSVTVQPSAVFDLFNDSFVTTLTECTDYLVAFLFFVWGVITLISFFQILRWTNTIETYLIRIQGYVFTLSRETRLQFEATLIIIFIFILYNAMMIATFDDDQEELIEFFHLISYYFFLSVFGYFLYKYSIHYFAFLDATQGESRTLGLIRQFLNDTVNSLSLVARFLILMVRLNIYDTVDDFLDSYYIFVCDFDDDEYFSELFFSIFSLMFFDSDVNDDRSFFFEDELDWMGDLFSLYFILWSKLSFFVLFALEEIARVLLAFYITYLILFEMQAVNRSFTEDNYFLTKKNL